MTREEEADQFLIDEGQGGFRPAFVKKAFLAGHSAGFAEAVAMLRSEEAVKYQSDYVEKEGVFLSSEEWADWLLESLGKTMKEKTNESSK